MTVEKKGIVIRTGCLACQARGLPCNGMSYACKKGRWTRWSSNRQLAVSTQTIDYGQDLTPIPQPTLDWDGTVRERQSLHFFCVTSAPELGGYIDTEFWQRVILQTAHEDDAIKHAVVALAAVHEHKMRQQASRFNGETENLHPFALRQCNKAITRLFRPSKLKTNNMLRTLSAAVLFACLQSFSEGRQAAYPHILHARQILDQLEASDLPTGTYPIVLDDIKPLVVHYESQIGHQTESGLQEMRTSMLNTADPVTIESLADARISLEKCVSSMGNELIAIEVDDNSTTGPSMADAKRKFQQWLGKWQHAFDTFVNRTQLGPAGLNVCTLLRMHFLAASITSRTDHTHGEATWSAFLPEFERLLDHAQDLLSHGLRRATQPLVYQQPYFSSTMGMVEPLYIVASRCPDPALAKHARDILASLPSSEGANSPWKVAFLENFFSHVTGKDKDKDKDKISHG